MGKRESLVKGLVSFHSVPGAERCNTRPHITSMLRPQQCRNVSDGIRIFINEKAFLEIHINMSNPCT